VRHFALAQFAAGRGSVVSNAATGAPGVMAAQGQAPEVSSLESQVGDGAKGTNHDPR
jgi:hypothetical protein